MDSRSAHTPVLLSEVLEILDPKPSDCVLDCTLGLGGHAASFLERILPGGHLTGLDADAENIERALENLKGASSHLTVYHRNFGELAQEESYDIVFADLGVSSVHFDDPSRGFSFREDGPLDMRLNRSGAIDAATLIENSSCDALADILFTFGEVRQSRKLAVILKEDLPKTTFELKASTEKLFSFRTPSYLPQVFQALRIAVNDEQSALEHLLRVAPTILRPGGRLGIISFHSLEDRLVKQAFRTLSTAAKDERTGADLHTPPFIVLTKKAIKPSEEEVERNPRSRSARLRVLKKR